MASRVAVLAKFARKINNSGFHKPFTRNMSVYTETGGINPKPSQVNFALPKVVLVTFPFLYLGASLSKSGAAFLEENDIFVPDDDDD